LGVKNAFCKLEADDAGYPIDGDFDSFGDESILDISLVRF